MNFNLLENGIDSLRQAQVNINENYMPKEFESFQLKDGLFNFVHGTEILAKHIIKEFNEEEIFSNKKRYQEAKKEMKNHHKSVFDVKPNLNTISAKDAVKLLKKDFNMDVNLCCNIIELINTRDSLMHYTVEMSEEAKIDFVEKLRICIDAVIQYYGNHIPGFKKTYDSLERHLPYTEYDRWEDELVAAAESRYEDSRFGI